MRAELDYEYHTPYRAERQLLHDCILQQLLDATFNNGTQRMCQRAERPWIVFTAGAMGAGKSHVLKWLASRGTFPLSAFVQSNPDHIRHMLPETAHYLARDRVSAGVFTHKEAGYIAEVLILAALDQGRNVLVDGSLRNAVWYETYINGLRRRYPAAQLAILHVTASEEMVLRRAAQRSTQTGRAIPLPVLLDTLHTVPPAVARLAPLADYAVHIENEHDGGEPMLRTAGETWDCFRRKFQEACPDSDGGGAGMAALGAAAAVAPAEELIQGRREAELEAPTPAMGTAEEGADRAHICRNSGEDAACGTCRLK
ncbi:unnamed protein product [Phaeothamnion confervicola]